jgi:3-hydroxybutyryl-CoA dehydrogenase
MTTICICGAGTMGSGIAQVAATVGFRTVVYDLNEAVLEKAKDKIEKDLQTLVGKQKITKEKKEAIGRQIQFTPLINQCLADLVIEAVVERPEVKISLFNQLAAFNPAETIFATNTSSLSVSTLAKEIVHPERVAGLHFFNPAPLMKLVEVVRGDQTSPEVVDALVQLARKLGKEPVVCKDAPGFIVNRVARPYYIESLRLVEEGLAGFETIDRLLESKGFRMGPFKLMDLIGNDVNYAVSCSVYEQLNFPERLRPSPIQKEKLGKGELGKKTGKGYYTYQNYDRINSDDARPDAGRGAPE